MNTLDAKDIRLLSLLQKNDQYTALELSEKLGMSASQIGRRRQRLEAEGYIDSFACRLNPDKLGLGVQAFIQIQTESQTGETHQSVMALVRTHPEIIAAWTLTGDADYIFRVYCTDLAALNHLVQKVLLPHPSIGRVQSQIVMEQMKDDTALPLPHPGGT
ncbi:Lrp/AsnC family transcriptional regulator [Celeribacter sp.]|uniref:Lrp/AsnC family transcriptional regulator n=1 Tax=Celeribacter sp. TaxID=1890673 RepID=UPI003A91D4BE